VQNKTGVAGLPFADLYMQEHLFHAKNLARVLHCEHEQLLADASFSDKAAHSH